jgi:hypothetical protein
MREADDPDDAYADIADDAEIPFQEAWLPG